MNFLKKVADWYFSKRTLPYWCILIIDCSIVFVCGLFAMYLANGGNYFVANFWQIVLGLFICLIPFIVFFKVFHTYSGIIRYSSFVDLQRLVLATLCGSAVMLVLGLIERFTSIDTDAIDFYIHIFHILSPPLLFVNCTEAAFFHTSATLQTFIRINHMRFFYAADDCSCRTDSGTKGTSLTLVRIDLVLQQVFTDTCRTLLVHNMRNIFISEIP